MKEQKLSYDITPSDPPNEGILFVDHSQNDRSGHLGHALVEYEKDKILAFYPNCSVDRKGHSAVGWMEYKRSLDGGKTWSESHILDYSKNMYEKDQKYSAMSEKAVLAEDGNIVLFNLVCDISEDVAWEPFQIPTYIRSNDGGHTWSDARNLSNKQGRIYDAIKYNDEILVLEFCNDGSDTFTGTTEEHVYELYVSTDNGKSFAKRSTLPFDTYDRGYGTMEILDDGEIIVYIYNKDDEQNPDYVLSNDGGNTWSEPETAYLENKIRNPQMVSIGDYYFMHGRSGHFGEKSGNFILYCSKDGINWDSGTYLRMQEAGHGAYSNNLVMGKFDSNTRNRLLIQASHAYEDHKTNILHWWLDNIPGA